MRLKARLAFSQLAIWSGGGAVSAVIGSTLGLWLAVFAVAIVGFIVVTTWDRIMPWRLRGGTAGNQHEPYQINVRESSEVSFRPFLRVAVEVGVANGSDMPLHIQSVHLDAILRRGLTKRRQPLDLECLQSGGKLLPRRQHALASLATVPPNEAFDGWAHFHLRRDFEADALRHFRFKIRLSNRHSLCVRFRVRETLRRLSGAVSNPDHCPTPFAC